MTLLDDFYLHGRYPHQMDPTLDIRIRALVYQLCDRVAVAVGTVPEVNVPANMNSYYFVSWPLQPNLPSDPLFVDVFSLSAPARYLTARVCYFAPLVELSWLELGHEDGQPYRRSAELLDTIVLETYPKAETIALAALEIAEELGLKQLSWACLRSPARPEWPREYWMSEQPEIRNYLFPGFFETWLEPEKKNNE